MHYAEPNKGFSMPDYHNNDFNHNKHNDNNTMISCFKNIYNIEYKLQQS